MARQILFVFTHTQSKDKRTNKPPAVMELIDHLLKAGLLTDAAVSSESLKFKVTSMIRDANKLPSPERLVPE